MAVYLDWGTQKLESTPARPDAQLTDGCLTVLFSGLVKLPPERPSCVRVSLVPEGCRMRLGHTTDYSGQRQTLPRQLPPPRDFCRVFLFGSSILTSTSDDGGYGEVVVGNWVSPGSLRHRKFSGTVVIGIDAISPFHKRYNTISTPGSNLRLFRRCGGSEASGPKHNFGAQALHLIPSCTKSVHHPDDGPDLCGPMQLQQSTVVRTAGQDDVADDLEHHQEDADGNGDEWCGSERDGEVRAGKREDAMPKNSEENVLG
ncbi:hypothetical protein C8R46DRAFT_1048055 [Mycena filopes]|nr:hypothetical protein C8R46DRAFT_1048055 [Mycena filopes]